MPSVSHWPFGGWCGGCRVVWFSVAWCGVVWCGAVCGVVWCGACARTCACVCHARASAVSVRARVRAHVAGRMVGEGTSKTNSSIIEHDTANVIVNSTETPT